MTHFVRNRYGIPDKRSFSKELGLELGNLDNLKLE